MFGGCPAGLSAPRRAPKLAAGLRGARPRPLWGQLIFLLGRSLRKNVYNITSFSPTILDLYKILKNQFPEFLLKYKIDRKRQEIINSWPNFIDDNQAKKDWGWEPEFNLNSAFKNYIYPNFKK